MEPLMGTLIETPIDALVDPLSGNPQKGDPIPGLAQKSPSQAAALWEPGPGEEPGRGRNDGCSWL